MPLLNDLRLTRRSILKSAAAATAAFALPSFSYASADAGFRSPTRTIHLVNPHTGDEINTVYWEKGVYHDEPMKDISYIMRDQHNDEMSPIDPKLVDILYQLQSKLRSKRPFEMVCGYRTPKSNAFIYKHERGVGKNSYHMYGRAIDIRMKDRSPGVIQKAAWALQQGGVGYYPKAGFVHIDTGGVRRW